MDRRTRRTTEPQSPTPYPTVDERVARLTELEEVLTRCPTDIVAREELATLLERLGQYEDALFNWKAVLARDSNSLKAREGLARCRQRRGRPLHSPM
jgi:cytochrome c-type biogenesis protein CcmH/NrfG